MKRRDFITLVGGAVLMAPRATRAQQKAARIGFLGLVSASSHASRTAALRAGLRDLGYIEGKNLVIEFRWAEGNYERLPALAEELVRLKVDVLLTHGASGAFAAKRATSTIPIVITAAGDMVELGLVSSLSRPGGNITGLSLFSAAYTAKRLELMKEAIPSLTKAALLLNPDNATYRLVVQEVETTAKALNVELRKFEARLPGDIERAFSAMADEKIEGVVIHEDTVLLANAAMIANLAMSQRLPSCGFPELVKAGGLIAYGINFPDMDYRATTFVDKILKGAKPGDLPVERSTKFDVIVNLKTAKAIGVTLPTAILLRADEVIE
jgi:putative ABC transport system substrate-binding protein